MTVLIRRRPARAAPAIEPGLGVDGTLYNRKNARPSQNMMASDGLHYRCAWIEDSITIHSDGNVSCGLDDPHGQRSFGNVNTDPIRDIFRNPEREKLRQRLWTGRRCKDCGHFRQVEGSDMPPAPKALPTTIVLETTVKCNIRCPNLPCLANNDASLTTRDADFITLDTAKQVIDQLAPVLTMIYFFNYGETFLNRQADDMLLYMRNACPGAHIVTSTNGIPLSSKRRAQAVAEAEPDSITFTISGVNQTAYERYHVNGKLIAALAGMTNVCQARSITGKSRPAVVWRYLAFHWNDTESEIDEAIALAETSGVDTFSLYLTNTPPEARSLRLSPGSPSFFRYLQYIHLDHLGRLDHTYDCAVPGPDGLWPVEEMPGFGRFQRMGSEATLTVAGSASSIEIQIATDHLICQTETHYCVLTTLWGAYRVPLTYGEWQPVEIFVPTRFRQADSISVRITTTDYWFPIAEGISQDRRCLGLMIRAEDEL